MNQVAFDIKVYRSSADRGCNDHNDLYAGVTLSSDKSNVSYKITEKYFSYIFLAAAIICKLAYGTSG